MKGVQLPMRSPPALELLVRPSCVVLAITQPTGSAVGILILVRYLGHGWRRLQGSKEPHETSLALGWACRQVFIPKRLPLAGGVKLQAKLLNQCSIIGFYDPRASMQAAVRVTVGPRSPSQIVESRAIQAHQIDSRGSSNKPSAIGHTIRNIHIIVPRVLGAGVRSFLNCEPRNRLLDFVDRKATPLKLPSPCVLVQLLGLSCAEADALLQQGNRDVRFFWDDLARKSSPSQQPGNVHSRQQTYLRSPNIGRH